MDIVLKCSLMSSLTECNSGTIQKLPIQQYWHLAGHVLNNKRAGIVRCIYYIFELNHSANSKWQFLSSATIVFSNTQRQCLNTI